MTDIEELIKQLRWPEGISSPDDHPISVRLRILAADALGWLTKLQPIETAPKDGSPFLGYSSDGVVYVCWSKGDDWVFFQNHKGDRWHFEPTKWLPLPALPQSFPQGTASE